MTIIGRISKNGSIYYQTPVQKDGEEKPEWLPVFVKKELNGEFEKVSSEKKVDKNGTIYDVIVIADKNAFRPKDENGKLSDKFIITK